MTYTYIANLIPKTADLPDNSILSQTLYKDEQITVILFQFAAGQELSEHTASMPATLHFLSGSARLTLGGDEQAAEVGTWVHMPARLPHSVMALTPTVMLLTLLKQ
ncbi:MAG: cupin domain-containing protein [Ardenticatenaceae bacterium]|nr:cupin domain-containing protein [Ardenticatenaceae bacterium]